MLISSRHGTFTSGVFTVKSSSSSSISLKPYLSRQSLSLGSSSSSSFLLFCKKYYWILCISCTDYIWKLYGLTDGISIYVWFLFVELSVQNILHRIYLYQMQTIQNLFRYYVVCSVIQTNLSFGRSSVCRFAVFLQSCLCFLFPHFPLQSFIFPFL